MKWKKQWTWFILASLIIVTIEAFLFSELSDHLDLDPHSFLHYFLWGLIGISLAIIYYFTGISQKRDVNNLK